MAILNFHFMILATFAMTGILISSDKVALAQLECAQGDLKGLTTQCAKYVNRLWAQTNPSPLCCKAIRTVDIPCACKYATTAIEAVIDMAKLAGVAKTCGKPLPRGTKCGSYTVP